MADLTPAGFSTPLSSFSTRLQIPEATDLPTSQRLFFLRAPLTVFGLVVSIVVDAVEAVFGRRTTSHVGKKVFVNLPSLAKGNASASVTFPVFVFGIRATASQRAPCGPLWRLMGFAVGSFCHPLRIAEELLRGQYVR